MPPPRDAPAAVHAMDTTSKSNHLISQGGVLCSCHYLAAQYPSRAARRLASTCWGTH